MCGIAGIIYKNFGSKDSTDLLEAFGKILHHRGPNHCGYFQNERGGYLNRRLAIVGTAGGNQPIFNDQKDIGIVFNGEVYNYLELRNELEKCGYKFQTNTDTEVILRAYEQYGVSAFDKLNGMFAFCIWDTRDDSVYLVRDHLGIKPLYIYESPNSYIFASEIKALLGVIPENLEVDPCGIQDYLCFRYIQAPFTPFKKIRRIDAGTYVRVHQGKALQQCYWQPTYTQKYPAISEVEAREELLRLLRQSVSSQLMGEVPIGVLLSGGVDSSAVAAMVHELGANLMTYNIGFPEVNEFEFSRDMAKSLGLAHTEVEINASDFITDFDKVLFSLDEPLADPACFPLYRLCEELKKRVVVVLSGEGGDELFGGYPQYRNQEVVKASVLSRFNQFLNRSYYFSDHVEYLNDKTIAPHTLRHVKHFQGLPALNAMLRYDMRTWMPENLMMKADKILMAHSLEGRFPFLDRNLYDFSCSLPESYKISPSGITKWILKEAVKTRVPESIIQRPKMGFSVPVDRMLLALKERVLESARQAKTGSLAEVLSMPKISRFFDAYYAKPQGGPTLQVWTIFIMLEWFNSARQGYIKNGPAGDFFRSSQSLAA